MNSRKERTRRGRQNVSVDKTVESADANNAANSKELSWQGGLNDKSDSDNINNYTYTQGDYDESNSCHTDKGQINENENMSSQNSDSQSAQPDGKKDKSYECEVCHIWLSAKYHLKRHMKTHTRETPNIRARKKTHTCETCQKMFSTKHSLDCHMRVHSEAGEKSLKCHLCKAEMPTEYEYDIHMRSHVEGNADALLGDLPAPVVAETKEKKPHVCDVCGADFARKFNLERHSRIHEGPIRYTCNNCGIGFTQCKALNIHKLSCFYQTRPRKTHTSNHLAKKSADEESKPFKCTVCGERFTTDTSLYNHETTHIGHKNYKCDICGKNLTTKSSLKRHRKTHIDGQPHICETCGRPFLTRAELEGHNYRRHFEPYICDVCGVCIKTNNERLQHKKRHTTDRPHMCDICGSTFRLKTHLNCHRTVHTGEKPYACKICGKKFRQSCSLTFHKRVHTGVTPFVCSECGKRFLNKRYYLIHQECHLKEKHFSCQFCDKKFAQEIALKAHGKKHRKENALRCDICETSFSNKISLQQHRKTHGDKPYKCGFCETYFASGDERVAHEKSHSISFMSELSSGQFIYPAKLDNQRTEHVEENPLLNRNRYDDQNNKMMEPHNNHSFDPATMHDPEAMMRANAEMRNYHMMFSQQVRDYSRYGLDKGRLEVESVAQMGAVNYHHDPMATGPVKMEGPNAPLLPSSHMNQNYWRYGGHDGKTVGTNYMMNNIPTQHGQEGHDFYDGNLATTRKLDDHVRAAMEGMCMIGESPAGYNYGRYPGLADGYNTQMTESSCGGDRQATCGGDREANYYPSMYSRLTAPDPSKDSTSSYMSNPQPSTTLDTFDTSSPAGGSLSDADASYDTNSNNITTKSDGQSTESGEVIQSNSLEISNTTPCQDSVKQSENIEKPDSEKSAGADSANQVVKTENPSFSNVMVDTQTNQMYLKYDLSDSKFQPGKNKEKKKKEQTVKETTRTTPPSKEPAKQENKPKKKYIRKKKFHCDVCGKVCTDSFKYECHKRTHTGEKPYKCNHCDKRYPSSTSLESHVRKHTKPFKCELCDEGYPYPGLLQKHIKSAHPGQEYEVPKIKKEPKKTKSLDPENIEAMTESFEAWFSAPKKTRRKIMALLRAKEKKLKSTTPKIHMCDICGKEFNYGRGLIRHRRIHTRDKLYTCKTCGAQFVQIGNLRGHERIHTGEKRYGCDVCGKKFRQSCALTTHMKRIHLKEKPHKCQVCGKGFLYQYAMKLHARIHTGEKNFQCNICGIFLASSSGLLHHKRIHAGEKPYKCDICGAGFTSSSNRLAHRRSHDKPFRCDICGAGFVFPGKLEKHKATHL